MERGNVANESTLIGKRVLVVDDSRDTHMMLGARLDVEGYAPILVSSGEEALRVIQQNGLPDIVLLDLMMPGMDGFQLGDAIQQMGPVPIICLSALTDVDTKVDAIKRFADDYVTKPFAFPELLARIQRVLRRASALDGADVEVKVDDQMRVSFAQQYAVVGGEKLALTPIETRILQLLYTHRGRVLPPEFLVQRVWDDTRKGSVESLWVHIRRLRSKIEPEPDNPRYVVTIRGQGYCMHI